LGLTLRLFKRPDDQAVWTESFSCRTSELIALERRALMEIVNWLGLRVSTDERQRIDSLLTNNLEAFRLCQEGWGVYGVKGGTRSGYNEVRQLAYKATRLDPQNLDAEFLDAYVLRTLALLDLAPWDVYPDLQRRMRVILDQDDTYSGALDQLGGCVLCYQRDWDRTYLLWNLSELYRADRERPFLRAFHYRVYGWFGEARVYQEEYERGNPTGVDFLCIAAGSRWCEGRYTEGAQIARRMLELHPGFADGYSALASCLIANGDYLEGIEASHKAQEVSMKQEMTALRGFAYAKMGQPEKAREVLQELLKAERTSPYLQPYYVARVYAGLNEKEKALDWLERADKEKSEYLIYGDMFGGLRTDLAWDDLKDESRFKELLKKVGLDQWPWPKPKPDPGKSINIR